MKQVLKQPWLWIACCSFVIAIAIAVISSVSQPNVPALTALEKGINKQDLKTILKAFTPEAQQELTLFGGLNLDFFNSDDITGKANIIYGEPVTDEDGDVSVQAFLLYNVGGQCIEAEHAEFDLEEIDGKLYLTY